MTQAMFDKIAKRYDFLNHLFSLGIDTWWRKQAVRALKKYKPKSILDVATGTGDLAIQLSTIKPEKIVGLDYSTRMLKIAKKKIRTKKLSTVIELQRADAKKLPYTNSSFDAVTIGFGIRNFAHLTQSLQEVRRVLKQKKHLLILELSKPKHSVLYNFYAKRIIPFVGGLISDKKSYRYLQKSTYQFMFGKELIQKISSQGFSLVKYQKMTLGICHLYVFQKKFLQVI